MIEPGYERLLRIAQPGTRVPVCREVLADLETPVSAYLKLARHAPPSGALAGYSFLLESVEGGEEAAHFSFIGAQPSSVATFEGGTGMMRHADGSTERLASGDPLEVLELQRARRPLVTDAEMRLPRFAGGAVGFLGYECGSIWEDVPMADGPATTPDAVLMFVDTLLAFDHRRHRALVVAHALIDDDPRAAYLDAVERIDGVVQALAAPLSTEPTGRVASPPHHAGAAPGQPPAVTSSMERRQFLDGVERVREHIAAGDIIQAVLSQRFSRATSADPLQVYRALRLVNPSPYMYLLELDGTSLAGASPELLVQVHGKDVATHPIAGTRPRGSDTLHDAQLEAELRTDPKERAEHVMLVDLGRNDIGRVAQPGSVQVSSLMDVERFSHVMHLTSHVTGRLRGDLAPVDALRACFPAGTVSGAPKIRAMQLLAGLEPDRRGPYAGAVGCFDYGGDLDAAITIRTVLMRDGTASVQAGAGIVADSVPEREFEETRSKARAMLHAIELAESLPPLPGIPCPSLQSEAGRAPAATALPLTT